MIRAIDVPAPPHVHERVREMVDAGRQGAAVRGPVFAGLRLRLGAAATVLAAGVAALVLALAGSGGAELTLAQASAVTLRPATMPAPRESAGNRSTLAASVEGVRFPYWGERFGWRATGSRFDRVGGRRFHTVFYSDGAGHTIGYAIVAGRAPSLSAAGTVHWREGTAYRLGAAGGVEVVTWKRDGRLCVVSGRGVPSGTLLTLASWDEQASAA
jgi:hypothetical protein